MLNNEEFKNKLHDLIGIYLDNELIKSEDSQNTTIINMAYEIEMLILDWDF